MIENLPDLICALFIALFFVFPSWAWMLFHESRARKAQEEALAAGRHEPASIIPFVNLKTCMGSGACVTACPEDVLKVIDGQAVAINASACVGHGTCVAVCPVDAIELVFGSEARGIDIPKSSPQFETNVPGLYVAGELGGMGLIANAIEQGAQAMGFAAKGIKKGVDAWDVVIVGAGPAGMGAGLIAKQLGLRYALLDQDALGGAILHFPRKKLVFTRPVDIPGYGRIKVSQLQKEELVDLFKQVAEKTGLEVRSGERVDEVKSRDDGLLTVTTPNETYVAQRVLLCLGRRGTPRKLGVPGEDQEKVAYALLEPDLYTHQHLLVVGGGDSAVEAAITLGEQEGNQVWLSYRQASLTRPKKKNLERLREAVRKGQVELLLESDVQEIGVDRVVLEQRGEQVTLPNDAVFVFAGGVLPTKFLQSAGVQVQRHHGKRVVALDDAPKQRA
jgi:thioredoxin reductase (NADPH)